MKRFLFSLFNPFLLALWVTLLILIIFPVRFPKYLGKEIVSEKNMNDLIQRYCDLDGDGNSELILTFTNSIGKAGVTISKNGGAIEQWNLHGTFNFCSRKGDVIFGDRDENGIKELYVFTISSDSIFLHCIENFNNSKPAIEKRFIERCGITRNKVDAYIVPAKMDDLNGDGIKELIFGIGTGFSLYPRNIFAYNIVTDQLISSPKSGYFLSGILQEDITGDGKKEIIPYGYAACNTKDSTIAYPDHSSWLMVLDQNLNFLFEPVEFQGKYSSVLPVVLYSNTKNPLLFALYLPPQNTGDSTQLFAFRINGENYMKKLMSPNTYNAFAIKYKNGQEYIFFTKDKEVLELYDTTFVRKKLVRIENANLLNVNTMDIDLDGVEELILNDVPKRKLYIYRADLSHPVELKYDGTGEHGFIFSIKEQSGKSPQLALQYGSDFYLFQYGLNPNYKLRFGIYASIYLCIFLFIWLIRKIQRIQIRKKQDIEKKITELQLQIVRNQLDPHFTLNAINSIISSIQNEEKEVARQHLMCFSNLHRSLLLSSDQVTRTLYEEINFTLNYLALERFRFKDTFDFKVDVDPTVDMETQLPKMILQIHVENAIKHGLALKKEKGEIKINCNQKEDKLIVEISDNGVGREYSSTHKEPSTGKGQSTIKQFTQLYNSYKKQNISTEVIDLFDDLGNPSGTTIRIIIPNGYEKK